MNKLAFQFSVVGLVSCGVSVQAELISRVQFVFLFGWDCIILPLLTLDRTYCTICDACPRDVHLNAFLSAVVKMY